jgi:hypothetical protein
MEVISDCNGGKMWWQNNHRKVEWVACEFLGTIVTDVQLKK